MRMIVAIAVFAVALLSLAAEQPYYGKRLEPRDGVLHGAGQDRTNFAAYVAAVGERKPVIWMGYTGLAGFMKPPRAGRGTVDRLNALGDLYVIPQIGLSMTTDGKPELHYEQDVAAGKYDKAITRLCEELKALKRPAFLRIGYEFNGRWNGYQPESYKAAFIRIVQALRLHGLDEVAAVWCYASDPRTKDTFMQYYPGDAYVDWWGIDLFSPEHLTAEDSMAFMREAAAHGCPVMIGESTPRYVGVKDGEASWARWYQPYFDFMRAYPQVKAFCYIACDWGATKAWPDWGDSRIWQNPVVLERYQRELADPIYRHNPGADGIRDLLGLPAVPAVPTTGAPALPLPNGKGLDQEFPPPGKD